MRRDFAAAAPTPASNTVLLANNRHVIGTVPTHLGGHTGSQVLSFAPRLDDRLAEALENLDDGLATYADLNRRLGVVAEGLGLCRPSYEEVRRSVHALRLEATEPAPAENLARIFVEVAYQLRPLDDLRRELDRRAAAGL
jgi:hypothetical protein